MTRKFQFLQGNTATGLRQFGVLIDQVSLRRAVSLAELHSYSILELPVNPGYPRHRSCDFGEIKHHRDEVEVLSWFNFDLTQDINFVSPVSTLTVNSGADQVAINCGKGSCTGMY